MGKNKLLIEYEEKVNKFIIKLVLFQSLIVAIVMVLASFNIIDAMNKSLFFTSLSILLFSGIIPFVQYKILGKNHPSLKYTNLIYFLCFSTIITVFGAITNDIPKLIWLNPFIISSLYFSKYMVNIVFSMGVILITLIDYNFSKNSNGLFATFLVLTCQASSSYVLLLFATKNSKSLLFSLINKEENLQNYMDTKTSEIKEISNGNININIEKSSDDDILSKSLINFVDTFKNLFGEIKNFSKNASEGNLNFRINTDEFKGIYKEFLDEINQILSQINKPILETSNALKLLSEGNLDIKINSNYHGDYKLISESFNNTVESLQIYIFDIDRALKEIENKNLSVSIDMEYKGNFGKIKTCLQSILHHLNSTIYDFSNASKTVFDSSRKISGSSSELAENATQQASNIEELTATISTVSDQVKVNAKKAAEASTLSDSIKEGVNNGNKKMTQMLDSIREINKASTNISNIIKAIEEIAFQTNILSLNASIEASRAGIYGKGFSVVANEVRNLAKKSSEAAKQTNEFLKTTIEKVEIGSNIANETASELNNVIKNINTSTNLSKNIADVSTTQATALFEISQSINEIAHVTSKTSITADKTAEEFQNLEVQSENLSKKINEFILNKSYGQIAKKNKTTEYSDTEKKELFSSIADKF